jgi:hypothetical protein
MNGCRVPRTEIAENEPAHGHDVEAADYTAMVGRALLTAVVE